MEVPSYLGRSLADALVFFGGDLSVSFVLGPSGGACSDKGVVGRTRGRTMAVVRATHLLANWRSAQAQGSDWLAIPRRGWANPGASLVCPR